MHKVAYQTTLCILPFGNLNIFINFNLQDREATNKTALLKYIFIYQLNYLGQFQMSTFMDHKINLVLIFSGMSYDIHNLKDGKDLLLQHTNEGFQEQTVFQI